MSRTAAVFVAACLTLTLAAAAVAGSQRGGEASATTVRVTEKEFTLVPRPKRARPGRVTFVVRNTGRLRHELVVLRTNRAAGSLPVRRGMAVETGKRGEIKPFPPRKTRRLSLNLRAGKYVLLCNVPGHYKAGQFAGFRVG